MAESSPPPELPPEYLREKSRFPGQRGIEAIVSTLNQQAVEKKFYQKGQDKKEMGGYESGLYYLYQPKTFESLIDQEMENPDVKIRVTGQRYTSTGALVKEERLESPSLVLEKVRLRYLHAIKDGKLSPAVTAAIVSREIEDYKNLRHRLSTDPNLAHRVLVQEELLLKLAKASALSPVQIGELSKEYPSLKVFFEKQRREDQTKLKAATVASKVVVPEVEIPPADINVAPVVVKVKPAHIPEVKTAPEVKVPLKPEPVVTAPPKISVLRETIQKQTQELAKLNAESKKILDKLSPEAKKLFKAINGLRTNLQSEATYQIAWRLRTVDYKGGELLNRFNLQPVLETVWNNRKFRYALMTGLMFTNLTASFTPDQQKYFSHLAEQFQNLPAAGANLSAEVKVALDQFRSDTDRLFSTAQESATTYLAGTWGHTTTQFSSYAVENPAAADVKTPEQLIAEFRAAEAPVPPPGFVHPETPAEGNYDKYIVAGYKSRTGSPYMKGLDYGAFPGAGMGDVLYPEDIDSIVTDANTKNIRSTMTSEKDIPRIAALTEKAHQKGIKVAVNYSTPELEPDKAKFRETVRKILSEAKPDYLQYENEMGWLDSNGKPTQYYSGSHESIWQDYPAYARIIQDEIRERVTGEKTKLVIGSLGWDFWANNSKVDKYIKGLIAAGVDFDQAYFDIHVFDHLDGQWDSQVHIARTMKIIEENGIKNAKYVSLENYIGSDQTPQYIGRSFDVYRSRYKFELIMAYPTTGNWMK